MTIRVGNNIISGQLPPQSDNSGKFLTTDGNTTSWNNAVDYSNVTNCITKIPQDIKLELNNGTLTLKAGSKVYVPNGFEQDQTKLYAWTSERGETFYTKSETPNLSDDTYTENGTYSGFVVHEVSGSTLILAGY